MPTSRTPSEKTVAKLQALPLADILTLLDALSRGDLEAAKKGGGGGVSRAELAGFQPDGETGVLLDGLEGRAVFLLLRQVGLAVLRALPVAIDTLRGIAEGVTPGDAAPSCEGDDKHTQALLTARVNMLPKVNEQRRLAALALFDVAERLSLFTKAQSYRAPDIEADEEAELQRMAEAQGIAYLPPLNTLNTTEQPLRRVK